MYPWGYIDWLLPKIGVDKWHMIGSSSFEERCGGVLSWTLKHDLLKSFSLINIENPSSEMWDVAVPLVEQQREKLKLELYKSGVACAEINVKLLGSVGSALKTHTLNPDSHKSVLLDISTLPKRYFLFALKQLLNNNVIHNLVVTYTRAAAYPEEILCENALPPASLQGFGRVEPHGGKPRIAIGVGYMPLSVDELMEQAKKAKLDFIFPFPPASPAFRRNWNLLAMLMPTDIPRDTEIHRIHGMDAFEVHARTVVWGRNRDLDLIPLGPKPHALGMAMTYLRLDSHANIIYPQPQIYNPFYSKGIAVLPSGEPAIVAYCLKKDGKQTF